MKKESSKGMNKKYSDCIVNSGDFLGGPVLGLCLPKQHVWVTTLVVELRPHIPRSPKPKTRNDIVRNSIKTLKTPRCFALNFKQLVWPGPFSFQVQRHQTGSWFG